MKTFVALERLSREMLIRKACVTLIIWKQWTALHDFHNLLFRLFAFGFPFKIWGAPLILGGGPGDV